MLQQSPKRRSPMALKLLLFFALPTMILFVGFAVIAHEVARRHLEAELGIRLEAIASAAATQIRGRYLAPLQPGDEQDDFVRGAKRKLLKLRDVTGVARIYVFDRDFGSRVDTEEGTVIGAHYFQAELDRVPIEEVFEHGHSVSSVIFAGRGGRQYKAGYAPIVANPGRDDTIVLAIGVDAPAAFFDQLSGFRRSLSIAGALLLLLVLIVAFIVAARMSLPLRRLAAAAERIGRGDLKEPIRLASSKRPDEIAMLAATMEEMRAELDSRDQRTQLMLSGIAHEVRNPLGGIELFSGILAEELEGDVRVEHVTRITREVNYLKDVVESFLNYARRDAPKLEGVDVDAVLGEVCELETQSADALRVTLDWQGGGLRCTADRGQLRRVVLNLVRNAVQAAAEDSNGHVQVESVRNGDQVWIVVKNNGPVIDEETLQHLFEPFFTTRAKGTGLGLAFVSEIIADHGGLIEVSSSIEDGTEFRFSIALG